MGRTGDSLVHEFPPRFGGWGAHRVNTVDGPKWGGPWIRWLLLLWFSPWICWVCYAFPEVLPVFAEKKWWGESARNKKGNLGKPKESQEKPMEQYGFLILLDLYRLVLDLFCSCFSCWLLWSGSQRLLAAESRNIPQHNLEEAPGSRNVFIKFL